MFLHWISSVSCVGAREVQECILFIVRWSHEFAGFMVYRAEAVVSVCSLFFSYYTGDVD